jgi:phosphohistidine swiveling domain-containing protein
MRIVFEKDYTRDFVLALGEAWLDALERLCVDSGWGVPSEPIYLCHMQNGVIEYWGNRNVLGWFTDRILAENMRGSQFLEKNIALYSDAIAEMKTLWEKATPATREELRRSIELYSTACVGWDVFYYSAGDERTPYDLRERAVKNRDADTLGASGNAFCERSLRSLYPELGEYARLILKEELENLPEAAELEQRLKDFTIIKNGEIELRAPLSLDQVAERYPQFRFDIQKVESTDLVRGAVCYKGKVRGPVRIVTRTKQIADVREGEVLVTFMTTPEYIPAMHKAAAFVTDEGGITSHAAIFAREMKKPCVIGTKFATQVFKTGDIVEVDAENGIVRKI